jgi:WD40 repeat protein
LIVGTTAMGEEPPLATTRPDDPRVARAMTLLRENCLACHNPEKRKGKLVLISRAGALKGGENGPALIAGKSAQSHMIAALADDADPHMPPKGQLTPDEIALLKSWIDAGAIWDEAVLTAPKLVSSTTRPIPLRPLPATYHPVLAIALSSDQKRLAMSRGDHILVFDLSRKDRPLTLELVTPNDVVQSLAWSGDGRWLASGGFRRLRLWDGQSANPVGEIAGLTGRVTALAFTPDGQTLVAAEGEAASPAMVHLWHVPDAQPIASWTAHADSILALKISGDGTLLATAGADKLVKLWDLPARKELAKLEGHAGPVMALALSADGTQLASAGADKELKIWKVKTREQTAALTTHPDPVTDLAWVDPKTLLSTCEDGLARFSSESSKERATRTFTGAPDVLYCAAVSKDGKMIYAGCHDGHVYVWSVAGGKLEGKLPTDEQPVKR